jgi:hypothetical protein
MWVFIVLLQCVYAFWIPHAAGKRWHCEAGWPVEGSEVDGVLILQREFKAKQLLWPVARWQMQHFKKKIILNRDFGHYVQAYGHHLEDYVI